MNSLIFINQDKKAIRKLLAEIGKYRYELALENMKIKDPPFSMEGFYLEVNPDCVFLAYRYPGGFTVNILKVDPHKYNIPLKGWELKKQNT